MIPPRYTSLHTLFSHLAKTEGQSGNRIEAAPVAAGRLQQLLVSGTLQAFRCDAVGVAVAIPATEWPTDSADFRREITRHKYIDAFVSNQAADALFVPPGPDRAAEGETRGRKPFEPEKLCAAVALAVHEGGIKASQKDTIEAIQKAYEQLYGKDTSPSRSKVQGIANAVMGALRVANETTRK